MRRSRPNLLLIVLDTARADAFEPWGAPPGASPTVAQLSVAGHTGRSVIAPACWTVPSHAAMFSGLLPRSMGLGRRGHTPEGYGATIRSHADRLLPTVLAANGYDTHAVSANLWISEQSGFDTGFSSFTNVRTTRRGDQSSDRLRSRARWQLEALRARADDGAAQVERLLDRFLHERTDEPFFWFVNLVECHSPYLPPAPYDDLRLPDRWRAGLDAHHHQTFEAFTRAALNGYDGTDEALARMRHLYARAVLLLDDWLARVVDRLDVAGVLDETLVVVTSDHGENFGECGLLGHAYSLDHRLIHVPLVAMGPGAAAVAGASSLVELPSRLAAALGLTRHPWSAVSAVPGVAISQLDAFVEAGDPRVDQAVRDLDLTDEGARRLVTSMSCAVDGRWKLLRRRGGEELYDLVTDPLEVVPLDVTTAPAAAPVAALRAALDDAAAREVDSSVHGNESVPNRSRDGDLEARMRLLGYL